MPRPESPEHGLLFDLDAVDGEMRGAAAYERDGHTARTLLRGSTFIKVGHHGSHNATSKTLVEEILPPGTHAMISTQQGEGNYRNNIPLRDLLDALTQRGIQFVRSDRGNEQLPDGFVAGDGMKWIDLELPC